MDKIDFEYEIKEPENYKGRTSNSLKINFFISIGIAVLVSIVSSWHYGLIIASVFFIIQYFKSNRWDKYFITFLKYNDDTITIHYKEEKEEKKQTGNKNDFEFKKEIAFNRMRTVYLGIYYKGKLLIKQFEIGEWNEVLFDKIINNLGVR